MTFFSNGPWTRPAATADEARPPSPGGSRDGVHFLYSRSANPHTDSRRVTLGLIAIAVLCIALVNLGVYQSSQTRMVEERWKKLAAETETARDQVRSLFHEFERRLRFLADDRRFQAWVEADLEGTISEADRHAYLAELERTAATFGLRHVIVLSAEGVATASAPLSYEPVAGAHTTIVQRAILSGLPWAADIHSEPDGTAVYEVAIPLTGAAFAGRAPVLVAAADAREELTPPLTRSWGEVGAGAFGCLVRASGTDLQYLTSPDLNRAAAPGTTVPLSLPEARPAAMASTGIEARIEQADEGKEAYCAVTRHLPELGWGIVGRVDRRVLEEGIRIVVLRLLVLDVTLVVLASLLLWQLRRSWREGMARTLRRVTKRHAERVQAIFDSTFDAIVTYDGNGRIQTVNRAAELLFGRNAEEIEGLPLHGILRWSIDGRTAPELPASGVVWSANAIRPDGETIPTEMSLGQSGEGPSLLYNAIIRDIRDRLEAERQIRTIAEGLAISNRRLEEMNAQLEEASRLKSEFLANTSHELRTPLNGIMGFLQLVLDGMCETDAERNEFLKQALQCSRHLLALINDVLDIARIEAGKLALDIQRVEVRALFHEVHTLTHVQAAQKGIRLTFEEPDDPEAAVRADMGKAKQVLVNLVGNSLKFTSRGTVTVRATAKPNLGHVIFEVKDTGIGIPAEHQHLIFEKFAQGDGSTTRKYGGAGLGLAISRSLVELMGGVIGVESEGRGKGATMHFSLPLWNDQVIVMESPEDGAEQITGPAGGRLVMIVEDDPVFRKFLGAVLHQHGYRTVEAGSAESAWVLLRRLKPDMVVLDYALSCGEGAGIRTGWDLAERMTTDADMRHVPMLFVTGFETEVRDRLTNTAFARKPEHLLKPIEPAALISKVEEMVGTISGRPIRLLMAEDDPVVTAYARKVLPEDRFLLEIAPNGEECLHILRTQPNGFDLLLLDLMMPGVSGYDVLRDMALTGTAARVPVLVLTNWPEPRNEEEKRLLEQGLVLEVVSKTSVHDDPNVLAHLIEWHLQARGEEPGSAAEAA
jgi:PAS domain S-box-containing protein